MASLRKMRTIARKQKEKAEVKAREREKNLKEYEVKRQQKDFRKGIKEALGFDRFKIKGSKLITGSKGEMNSHPLSTKWDKNY